MQKLKAIADSHPQGIFHNILYWNFEMFLESGFQADLVNRIYMRSIEERPDCVREEGFWKLVGDQILQKIRDEEIRNYGTRPDWRTDRTKSILRDLESCRRIWDHQFSEIDRGEFELLFLEGVKQPQGMYAIRKGIKVVYLDQGLKIHTDEYGLPTYDAQLQRESRWVEAILGFSECVNNSLIIAGANHIDGKYGLDKKLLDAGISLVKIANYDGLIDEIAKEPRFCDSLS